MPDNVQGITANGLKTIHHWMLPSVPTVDECAGADTVNNVLYSGGGAVTYETISTRIPFDWLGSRIESRVLCAAGILVGGALVVRGVQRAITQLIKTEPNTKNDEDFPITTHDSRKENVISNILKGVTITSIAPMAFVTMARGLTLNDWCNWNARTLGAIYCSLDLASTVGALVTAEPIDVNEDAPALEKWRKWLLGPMKFSTLFHHAATVTLGIVSLLTDYTQPTLMRAAVVNGTFSSISGPVNVYLAARWLRPKGDPTMEEFRRKAAMLYTACLVLNWPLQMNVVMATMQQSQQTPWKVGLFIMANIMLLYDDMRLVSFMWTSQVPAIVISDEVIPSSANQPEVVVVHTDK